jgi:hypothetical protein
MRFGVLRKLLCVPSRAASCTAGTFNWADPLHLEHRLTQEERAVRDQVRDSLQLHFLKQYCAGATVLPGQADAADPSSQPRREVSCAALWRGRGREAHVVFCASSRFDREIMSEMGAMGMSFFCGPLFFLFE